jgi:hypothetical protein
MKSVEGVGGFILKAVGVGAIVLSEAGGGAMPFPLPANELLIRTSSGQTELLKMTTDQNDMPQVQLTPLDSAGTPVTADLEVMGVVDNACGLAGVVSNFETGGQRGYDLEIADTASCMQTIDLNETLEPDPSREIETADGSHAEVITTSENWIGILPRQGGTLSADEYADALSIVWRVCGGEQANIPLGNNNLPVAELTFTNDSSCASEIS